MAEDRKEGLDDLDMVEDIDDIQEAPLFWSLKVPASGEGVDIEAPPVASYIVHITKACFGTTMKQNSRTVLLCDGGEDGEQVPVCVLNARTCENVALDLLFNESATFKVAGNKASDVWLTGHYQPSLEPDEPDMYDDEAMLQGLGPDGLEGLEDDDIDIDDDGDDVAPELIEEDDNNNNLNESESVDILPSPQKKRKLNNSEAKPTANGKANKNKSKKSPKTKPVQPETNENKNKKSPKQKPAKPQSPATQAETENKANTTEQEGTKKKKNKKKNKKEKKKLGGGLEYKDIRAGNGTAIKKGDRVSVYYIGQLASNQKIFDKTLNGSGFEFTVGAGEVIKGWDMGIVGMKGVGAKRKLWIPAKLAYGNEDQNGIPANSELLFTVEVKKVQ